ncbi:MAG: D-aminoacylase [Promethearchaeota archaeon]|nr:MAG: D-aminoacylase [Candidatus Lokiarchaeota archaeon]
MDLDILIKNGIIIDGTGKLGYKSDILIKDDKIERIGTNIVNEGFRIIDASKKIVAPGFIDIHHHGDLSILDVNKAEAALKQGVTTLNVGMCGLGLAPANDKVRKYYFNYVSKAFGGSSELFDNLQDFFEAIENKGISPNLVFFIPHGNVRAYVMGTDDRSATDEELDQMKRIIKDGMEAGAFGMSTGLVYPPGSTTPTDELIELSKVVSDYNGIYMSHMRNEGSHVIDIGMAELIKIAKEANIKSHISHWSVISKFAQKITPQVINLIKEARESEKLQISADAVPYDDGSTSLSFILLSLWVYENFEENLTIPEKRKILLDDIYEKLYSMFFADAPFYIRIIPKFILRKLIFTGLAKLVRVISAEKNKQVEGKTLYEVFKELFPDRKLEDALLDFILEEKGDIMIQIKHKEEEINVIPILKQDFVCVSSDGFLVVNKNTHPTSYGAFARILERYVREMRIFSLEEAIKKMTSLPASVLGLSDRGLIKEGYKADLVIFELEKIREKGTLLNGAQHPEGIEYVIVNGDITVSNGRHTGILKGRILKHH